MFANLTPTEIVWKHFGNYITDEVFQNKIQDSTELIEDIYSLFDEVIKGERTFHVWEMLLPSFENVDWDFLYLKARYLSC